MTCLTGAIKFALKVVTQYVCNFHRKRFIAKIAMVD